MVQVPILSDDQIAYLRDEFQRAYEEIDKLPLPAYMGLIPAMLERLRVDWAVWSLVGIDVQHGQILRVWVGEEEVDLGVVPVQFLECLVSMPDDGGGHRTYRQGMFRLAEVGGGYHFDHLINGLGGSEDGNQEQSG